MSAAASHITDPSFLVALSAAFAAASGVPGLVLQNPPLGRHAATLAIIIAALLGLAGVFACFLTGSAAPYSILGAVPFGPFDFGLDHLSSFFLIPVLLISACCSIYGTTYPAANNPRALAKLSFFFGTLTAALITLITAQNGILFLLAWEIMALSAFFVMTTEDSKQEVEDAGLIYIVSTHIGTLALFALFSLLGLAASSYQFSDMATITLSAPIAGVIFCIALFGFGLKAGLMPLHIWLPSAHAAAPSHISAIMSGVMIKTGVYGMLRVLSFFPHPPLWWGITLLIAGTISAIMGVAFALGQHDIKRLLAYHSIENIGIIFIGIGLAAIGQAVDLPILSLLGMAGALLHTLNHALFKSLLFLGAGAAIHASHTRNIDLMGGIAKRLPWTSGLFLTGAVAICGLPPLNGFVSEYFIYLGIFNGVTGGIGPAVPLMALAAPALAMVGALAVACFVKVCGIAFLGTARLQQDENLREVSWLMRAPMIFLAALCVTIGLFPQVTMNLLQPAILTWAAHLRGYMIPEVAPLTWITILALALLAVAAVLTVGLLRARRTGTSHGETWGCGYLKPTPRMQYSASSFAEMVVKLFRGGLRPHWEKPRITGSMAENASFSSHVPEAVLELIIMPLFNRADRRLKRLRRLQHGQLPLYILYIFIILCLLLTWALQLA